MSELDSFLGCGHSTWVIDSNMRWRDDFILSGADVKPAEGNRSRIWRITPARPAEFRFPRQSPGRALLQPHGAPPQPAPCTPHGHPTAHTVSWVAGIRCTLTFDVSLWIDGAATACSLAFPSALLLRSSVSNFGWWISQQTTEQVVVNCSSLQLVTTWPLPKEG
jgi:hypothetical protein